MLAVWTTEKQYWNKVTLSSRGPVTWCARQPNSFHRSLLPFLTNKTKEGHIQALRGSTITSLPLRLGGAGCSPAWAAVNVALRRHIAALSLAGLSPLASPNLKCHKVEICSVFSFVCHFLLLSVWLPIGRVALASTTIAASGSWLVQLNSGPVLMQKKWVLKMIFKRLQRVTWGFERIKTLPYFSGALF